MKSLFSIIFILLLTRVFSGYIVNIVEVAFYICCINDVLSIFNEFAKLLFVVYSFCNVTSNTNSVTVFKNRIIPLNPFLFIVFCLKKNCNCFFQITILDFRKRTGFFTNYFPYLPPAFA